MLKTLLLASLVDAKAHPKVTATNDIVDIDVRGSTDYFGPIFIGNEQLLNHMIYDTMSDWTIVLDAEADN